MQIQTIDNYTGELEDVVNNSDSATFYHSRVWIECLAATFPRMDFRSLVAVSAGSVEGFLPYFVVRRGPFRVVWSLPFGTYGGPVAGDRRVASALVDEFSRTLLPAGVLLAGWVDFGDSADPASGWRRQVLQTHLIDLSSGFDTLWESTIDRQRRKRTRRAERLGVTVRLAEGEIDLRSYYSIYSDRIDQWGGRNQYPESFFSMLLERGGDSVRLYVAEHDGVVVGGHFNFYHRDMVTAWQGVTTRESNHLQPGSLLYTRCLEDACARGYRVYNLGGSLDKRSLIDFKESLGGVPYEYCLYTRWSLLGRVAALVKRTVS